MPYIRRFVNSLSTTGLILGLAFCCISLTPSLLPRMFVFQGILSGLVFAVGYGIGKGCYWTWQFMELKILSKRPARMVAWIMGVILTITAFFTLSRTAAWQNSIRMRMEMEPINHAYPFGVLLVTVSTALAVILVGRLILFFVKKTVGLANRWLPRRISIILGSAIFMLLLLSFVDKIILKAALDVMDKSFAVVNRVLDDEYDAPEADIASGSARSLIDWNDIGRNGKLFVSDGPTEEDITAVLGRKAMQPIRVYAGFDTGETLRERAQIALAELKRVGGFDRSTLIIASSTGTGWLDPSAVDTVEFIHAGDIATVSLQYSYLPSWLTLMVEPELAREAGSALFNEVYGYWTRLPHEGRPKLYLHGLSLGALGSEASTDLITIISDPIDGALWSGPPFLSTTWSQATANRNPGSPQWRPIFRDSTAIRFMTQDGFPDLAAAEWGSLRIVYLQHASDPMSFFSPNLAYVRPKWLNSDRGRDVSPDFRWFPVVTFFQVAFDIPMATAVPLGYGHNFAPASYIDAWIEVTQPKSWTAADTEKLKIHFRGFNPRPL